MRQVVYYVLRPPSNDFLDIPSSTISVNTSTTYDYWVRLACQEEGQEIRVRVVSEGIASHTPPPTVYDLRLAIADKFMQVYKFKIKNTPVMRMTCGEIVCLCLDNYY